MNDNVADKLKKLPDSPGVYLMKDKKGDIIYVGKSSSIKNRAASHFQPDSPKEMALVKNTEDIDYIVTNSEVDALVLEANLIKEESPRYNVRLRDDKRYPYIMVTVNEKYPRITIARKPARNGARYFGPYPKSGHVRGILKMASKLFGIRHCKKKLTERKTNEPCLNSHIYQCFAPCSKEVTREEYLVAVKNTIKFLEGRHNELIDELTQKMETFAEKQEFESAARVRDQITALKLLDERQQVAFLREDDLDYIGLAHNETGCVVVLHVRSGKLVGKTDFTLVTAGSNDGEILSVFISQYYQNNAIPQEIVIQTEVKDNALLDWLKGIQKGIKIHVPLRGKDRTLLDMAVKNAQMLLSEKELKEMEKERLIPLSIANLKDRLGLPVLPARIEAFDISDISGTSAVGSMVVFEHGIPDKSSYRRYRIKSVKGIDDFAMMKEVVSRRYSKPERLPDLILIDGGAGQLNSALAALSEQGLDIPAIGLAKEFEEIYRPGKTHPVRLPEGSPELRLLQQIRDEAHRFAISYHRKLRSRKLGESALDSIPGIGESRKKTLLHRFGSVEAIRNADIGELEKVPGIGKEMAGKIHEALNKKVYRIL